MEKLVKLKDNPLVKGSAILIVGTNIASFFAYIYHLIFGRILGPSLYGEIAVFISLVTLLAASFASLGMVIMKFVASEEEYKISVFYRWVEKRISILAIVLLVILLPASIVLSKSLNMPLSVMLLFPPTIAGLLFFNVYRSFLQGLLKFKEAVVVINLDLVGRLLIGLTLVYLGLSVFGATLAILLGVMLALFLGRRFLKRFNIKGVNEFKDGKKIYKFALPVLLVTVAFSSFITMDVVLVKKFFDSHEAGIYAALSTLGKIIVYGTIPVATAMFPLTAKKFSRKESNRKVFLFSAALTLLIGSAVLVVFLFAPQFTVGLLFGAAYIEASVLLFMFGLFAVLYTLNYLVASFYLSVEKMRVAFIAPVGALLQIAGIIIFHNTLMEVIVVSIVASLAFSGILFLYGLISFKYINRLLP